MGVSMRELKEVCQRPVRDGNDVAGLLFGDHLSLPVTKLFVDRGISPDVATVGMLVCGLAGALCQALSPALAVPGAVLLLLYYVLDCVDGEVARYRKIEDIRWGHHEYVFHMLVKPCAFLGVGIGLWRELGQEAALWASVAAAVSVLWLKLLPEVAGIQFTHHVVGATPERNRSFRRLLEGVDLGADGDGERGVFRLGPNAMTLRAALTNFDVGLLLLLVVCVADRFVPRFTLLGDAHLSLRTLWMLFYGVVVPLDFLDRLLTDLRDGGWRATLRALMRDAHRFDVEEHRRGDGEDD